MISAVLDANTLVSATLSQRSAPHQIVLAARARRFRLITGSAIIAEVLRALSRPRVQRRYGIGPADLRIVQDLLTHEATVTPVTATVQGVATHPEDDLILATAVSAEAEYLVTFDRQLLRLGSYQGVSIVSPHQFAALLSQPSS